MQNRAATLFAVILTLALVPPGPSHASEPERLVEAIDAFYSTIEKADVEARLELMAEDVILMPNHWTVMRGKAAVAESFRRGAGAIFQLKDREVLRMEVSGDLAYTVNAYAYTYHGADESAQWHRTKNVHIWRRDGSGDWKLAVDIWNSDVAIGQFAEE